METPEPCVGAGGGGGCFCRDLTVLGCALRSHAVSSRDTVSTHKGRLIRSLEMAIFQMCPQIPAVSPFRRWRLILLPRTAGWTLRLASEGQSVAGGKGCRLRSGYGGRLGSPLAPAPLASLALGEAASRARGGEVRGARSRISRSCSREVSSEAGPPAPAKPSEPAVPVSGSAATSRKVRQTHLTKLLLDF